MRAEMGDDQMGKSWKRRGVVVVDEHSCIQHAGQHQHQLGLRYDDHDQ